MRLDNLVTPAKKQFNEGLRSGDLEYLILPIVTVDDFEPKSGSADNIVVMTFYAKDLEPANDFATFIERGTHKILDTEVSPAPDENGNYLIFIEMNRDETMFDIAKKILKDVDKLVNVNKWAITFHKAEPIIIERGML
jgi:hypothetical protein